MVATAPAAFMASAAIVAAAVSTAQGMHVQQERYNTFYDNNLNKNTFFTDANPVAKASPEDRVNTFEPSVAERSFLNRIDFTAQNRPTDTRIFSGLIDVTEGYGGDYIWRVTSDDASHLLIDGEVVLDHGGSHDPSAKWVKLTLERGKKYSMQLWWGNNKLESTMKLEYCKTQQTVEVAEELAGVLSGDTIGGVAGELFSDEDLALAGCTFTTDLSDIFKKHDKVRTVRRCDYEGYFSDDPKWFPEPGSSDKVSTRWLPDGCTDESGGIIAANPYGGGIDEATNKSFTFSTAIAARVSGMHTFWVEADDGALLYIGDTMVVDNSGFHAPTWRKGTIYLEEGEVHKLVVYYGNAGFDGKLDVMWEDHMMAQPQQSLLPIMV